jgi:hypothetical protein
MKQNIKPGISCIGEIMLDMSTAWYRDPKLSSGTYIRLVPCIPTVKLLLDWYRSLGIENIITVPHITMLMTPRTLRYPCAEYTEIVDIPPEDTELKVLVNENDQRLLIADIHHPGVMVRYLQIHHHALMRPKHPPHLSIAKNYTPPTIPCKQIPFPISFYKEQVDNLITKPQNEKEFRSVGYSSLARHVR